jgi:hypothetical protein
VAESTHLNDKPETKISLDMALGGEGRGKENDKESTISKFTLHLCR